MELRLYQSEAVAAVYQHLRERDDNPCVVIPTGGGKTPIMATICTDAVKCWDGRVIVLAHVKELLEQTAGTLQRMAPDLDIGVYSAGLGRRDTDHAVIVAGIQSVYKRAAELDRFDLVLMDECFPAGTTVSTPRGEVPIEEIHVSQSVHTALGLGEVEVISARPTNRLIKLEMEDGRTIRCTPSHRFFTEHGWQKAEALEVGSCLFSREDVQALRDTDAPANLSPPERLPGAMHIGNGVASADVLLTEVRGSAETQDTAAPPPKAPLVAVGTNPLRHQDLPMLWGNVPALDQDGPGRQNNRPSEGGGLEAAAILLDLLRKEDGECGVATRCPRKDQPDATKDRPRAGLPRRKRQADDATGADVELAGSRLEGGILGSDRSTARRRCAHEHQARYRPSEAADRHRTGRPLPRVTPQPKDGPAADGALASQRVAHIARVQCESPVPVFNLQVKGHPSYYADGVLAHNCHLLPPDGEGMYRTFLADAQIVNPNVRLIGLTATPFRMTTGMICSPDHLLNHVCYEVGVKELIRDGYLCPLRSKAGVVRADTSGLHVRGGEYIATEVEDLMDEDELVRAACAELVEQTRDRVATLIFASGVKHGRHIQHVLENDHGVECGFVCGQTPAAEREHLIARFRGDDQAGLFGEAGPLKYLCNVNVLTTGFDAPNIDCVALLRPTMSPGLYYQQIGRGLRLHPGKDDCLVLDFAGNILRHGPVDQVRIEESDERSGGEAPAKECPECHAVVAAGYATCPECGHVFPPPERKKHKSKASTESVLSGEINLVDYEVEGVSYAVHTKRGAPPDHPKTLRVEYQVDFQNWFSEWVCIEHTGWPRQKAESWWRERSDEPCPDTAEEAVAVAHDGGLAETLAIKVRHVSGEKYPTVVGYTLGLKPRLPGWDEVEQEPESAMARFGLDEDDVPF